MSEATVRVKGLVKRYGTSTAVKEINLQIEKGEVFGLLGPNGAGKTTTLECMGTPTPLVQMRESGIIRAFRVNGIPGAATLAVSALSAFLHLLIVSMGAQPGKACYYLAYRQGLYG